MGKDGEVQGHGAVAAAFGLSIIDILACLGAFLAIKENGFALADGSVDILVVIRVRLDGDVGDVILSVFVVGNRIEVESHLFREQRAP